MDRDRKLLRKFCRDHGALVDGSNTSNHALLPARLRGFVPDATRGSSRVLVRRGDDQASALVHRIGFRNGVRLKHLFVSLRRSQPLMISVLVCYTHLDAADEHFLRVLIGSSFNQPCATRDQAANEPSAECSPVLSVIDGNLLTKPR